MRVKPLIAIPLIAIALAGCSSQQPAPQNSTATAEEKPLFATDEEALAAAQAAYAHYLEVSDQIARDGGANPERLKGLVSEQQYENELQNYKEYASSGLHSSGRSSFDSIHISNSSQQAISAYLCVDVTNSGVLNSAGNDVTPEGRVDRWPLVVNFKFEPPGDLLISGSETWTGKNFC
jgi:uncharacterized protein YcfL